MGWSRRWLPDGSTLRHTPWPPICNGSGRDSSWHATPRLSPGSPTGGCQAVPARCGALTAIEWRRQWGMSKTLTANSVD